MGGGLRWNWPYCSNYERLAGKTLFIKDGAGFAFNRLSFDELEQDEKVGNKNVGFPTFLNMDILLSDSVQGLA